MLPEVHLFAAARPNLPKLAALWHALGERQPFCRPVLVHTGQHHDDALFGALLRDLELPQPEIALGVAGGSHAEQTAKVMVALEAELLSNPADAVLVVGDVNSTLAGAIVAKKLQLELIHVEAGLRSGDRAMPEEINRLATDAITDLFFVTEPSGEEALLKEGHAPERIHFVGNVMIDNLFYQLEQLRSGAHVPAFEELRRELQGRPYGVVTLHRPSNVDVEPTLRGLVGALRTIARDLPLVFPMHPRTRMRCEAAGIDLGPDIRVVPPLSYMDFLSFWKDAQLVLTDSGGLQEETTALGVRCVTLRDSTERPVTLTEGTNVLAGSDPDRILACVAESLASEPSPKRPRFWDGRAAERIAAVLVEKCQIG